MSKLQKIWTREAPYQPGIFLDVTDINNIRTGIAEKGIIRGKKRPFF